MLDRRERIVILMKELLPLQILRGSSKAFSVCLQRLPAHEENVPIGLLQASMQFV